MSYGHDKEDGPCGCVCHEHGAAMHIQPCCAYTHEPRTIAEAEARLAREKIGEDKTDRPPKYSAGQRVIVNGWTGNALGTVVEIKRIYHNRLFEWVWGYRIDYEKGGNPGLSLDYVPEGYLQVPE